MNVCVLEASGVTGMAPDGLWVVVARGIAGWVAVACGSGISDGSAGSTGCEVSGWAELARKTTGAFCALAPKAITIANEVSATASAM